MSRAMSPKRPSTGLFKMIASQEETIRANPAAAVSRLAKQVFSAL